ncbi:protein pyrBI [Clostridium sp. chh4-2]|uniref:protein pyrBI n=1 Tax=Clostridium sp. chh4-2 TaxID=2067550 RepID=UPI000CCE8369|nr:protein pyrBI [Clostridium sp. chh4-2]PNV60428.1 protein pyrBI [Clostridium sp. chh4-2]
MRRILSACLLQTIKFDAANDANPQQEYSIYCERMKKNNTSFSIEETTTEPDGSLIIKIKKQYNSYKTDGYMP